MNHLPSRTEWAQSVRRGAQPTARELRDHLITVHKANAGFTESCATRCRDAFGRNSYEWLADVIDPAVHGSMLDLACGSGPLLEHCFGRFGAGLSLAGVDMSADELALARARLKGAPVRLHQSVAQELGVFERASIDAILCHWALTLMDPVEPVLAEARRLLAAGGVFAAIVDGDAAADPGYSAVNDVVYGWVRREFPLYGEVELGDPRVRRAEDLLRLARRSFGTEAVTIDAGVFVLEGECRALAREAAGFFYSSFVLSPDAHAAMLDDLAALLSGGNGHGRFSMPVNRLVVRLPPEER